MKRNFERILFVIILFCSSLLFFKTPGTADVNDKLGMVHNADTYGIVKGYAVDKLDYPPFGSLILFTVV